MDEQKGCVSGDSSDDPLLLQELESKYEARNFQSSFGRGKAGTRGAI